METQNRKRILLIDDDASLLVTLSDFFKFEGYEVVTADSGEQGVKRLARYTPDLIILDMSMPGMGGVGFLKEISSSEGKPRFPVLVLTARANMAEFFANVEVDGFVSKPCDPNDLLMEVSRIIFLRSSDVGAEEYDGTYSRKKILLGEDDRTVCDNLVTAFADAGYVVDSASKGPDALEKAIVQRPDAIVIKLVLANMNGDAVANMLKEMPATREIPVILYDDSGSEVPESRYAGIRGVKKFVRGNNSVKLLAAVKEVLRD